MGVTPGQITVKISAVIEDFQKALREAQGSLVAFSQKSADVGKSMSLFISLPLLGAGAAAVKASADFETLQTSLKTILGSSEAAKNAMAWIEDFSAKTPYQMDNVAAAFSKLSANGFDATKYLQILGDTASAMGKSLDQSVDMFTDAATGEFERLKEFGIKARTEGDKVTFSWQENGKNVTKTVNKTNTDITQGLASILSKFKGGMEEQSKTLNGSLSNMMDNLSRLGRVVGDMLAPMVKTMADFFGSLARSLSDMDETTKTVVVSVGIFAALLGPLLLTVGSLGIAFTAMTAGLAGNAVASNASTLALSINKGAMIVHTAATYAASAAMAVFNAVMAANPIGLVIVGISTLCAGIVALGSYLYDASMEAEEAAFDIQRFNKALSGTLEVSAEVKNSVDEMARAYAGLTEQQQINRYKFEYSQAVIKGKLEEAAAWKQRMDAAEAAADKKKDSARAAATEKWLTDQKQAQDKYRDMVNTYGDDAVTAREKQYQKELDDLGEANRKKFISDELYAQSAEILEKKKNDDIAAINKEAREKEEAEREKFNENLKSSIGFAWGQMQNIASMYYSNQAAEVDNLQTKRLNAVEEWYDAEKERIEQTVTDTTQRNADLDALDKERARQEKAINDKAEKDKRKIQRESAKVEKGIAVVNTTINTAEAIMKAWAQLGPIGGPIMSGIIGTLGATQIGLILSQPLPALAQGGYFSGPALIGEQGREFAFPLDGPQGQNAMALMADQLLDRLSARLERSSAKPTATIEKSERSSLGGMTIILQDAGRTFGKFICDTVTDGTRTGECILYGRAVVA